MATNNTSGGVTGFANGLLGTFTGWVNKLFSYVDNLQAGNGFFAKYGKYFILILLLLALGKVAKIKVNVGGKKS